MTLLIVGASARAAAGSALRAGFSPVCADLFADADLAAVAPVTRLDLNAYPQGFLDLARTAPSCPWLYTGGLENYPALVQAISAERLLLGNDAWALKRARAPRFLTALFRGAGLPHPALLDDAFPPPAHCRWLAKPLHGAGGRGIHFLDDAQRSVGRGVYVQEYIAGESCSAVYVGDGTSAELLGVTAQLIGAPALHAAPFHYCGSIGPLPLTTACQQAFARLGGVVASLCGLRGLFGVDAVLADGVPYPVEVNPRYPASVEVLEHALGAAALRRHVEAFDPRPGGDYVGQASRPADAPGRPGGLPHESRSDPLQTADAPRWPIVGKAILFAATAVAFPADGPWIDDLRSFDPWRLPGFADLPHPGDRIEAGRPILTLFCWADSVDECRRELERRAADVERRLLPG